MKKIVKKIVPLVLVLCSVFTLCFPIFAVQTTYSDSASAPVYTANKSNTMYSILQTYAESEHASEVFYKGGIRLSSGEYAYGYIGYNAEVKAFYIMTLGIENDENAGYRWTYKFDYDGYWKYRVSYDTSSDKNDWVEVSGFNAQFYDHKTGIFTSVPEKCNFLFTETSESFVPDSSVIYTYGQVNGLEKNFSTHIPHGQTLFSGYCYIDVLGIEAQSVRMYVPAASEGNKIVITSNVGDGDTVLLTYDASDCKWTDASGEKYDSIKLRIGSVIKISALFHFAFEHLGKRYITASPEVITSLLERYKDFSTSQFICNAYVSVKYGMNQFVGKEESDLSSYNDYIKELYTDDKIAKVQFRYEPGTDGNNGYLRVISFSKSGSLNDRAFLKYVNGKWYFDRFFINSNRTDNYSPEYLTFVFYNYEDQSLTADVPAELNSYFVLEDFCESHSYMNGVCVNCGFACTHIEFKKGSFDATKNTAKCKDCGSLVSHSNHNFRSEGPTPTSEGVIMDLYVCDLCGFSKYVNNCSHTWEYDSENLVNRCTKCNLTCYCPTESWEYDPASGKEVCSVCGRQWTHFHTYHLSDDIPGGTDETGEYRIEVCSRCGDQLKKYTSEDKKPTGGGNQTGNVGKSDDKASFDFSKVVGLLAIVTLIAGVSYLYVVFSGKNNKSGTRKK